MTRDRRGFSYALEPVRSMTAWEIDAIAAELAPLNAAAAQARQKVDLLAASFDAARFDAIAQRGPQAVLDIAAQRRAHGFMLQVQRRLREETAALHQAEEERDAAHQRLVQARKFAESLDRDKEAQAGEHDQQVAKQDYQLSDDNWLQRIHWRKTT
jgi:hypothetical protein